MTTLNTKDNLLIAVLAKLVSEGKAKKVIADMDPGEYEVDEVFHICGNFRLSEPETKEMPHKARPWTLLARLAEALPPQTVERIVKEHVHEPVKSAKKLEDTTKKKFKDILDALGETTMTTSNGKTKFEGNCDLMDDDDIIEMSGTIKATKVA